MPSMDSNSSSSSSYSSSESSTSSLSSPRVPITDIVQHPPMRIPPTTIPPTLSVSGTHSHGCLTRYKTELCRPFTETGKCKYGDKCQFSHGTNELRILMRHPKYKTEYCRTFHTTGYCPYGPRCHFIHDIHEARTAINPHETTVRRHSDVRTNSSGRKSITRNRFNSDYVTHSEQSSKFPWTLEELNRALLSFDTGDVFQQEQPMIQIQSQYQQQQQQQQQTYPSMSTSLTNSLTCRTFSSSSSSNSSLTPQYI